MKRLVLSTIIPTWRGLALPLPLGARLLLFLSWSVADAGALRWYGRPFAALPVAQREAVIQRLMHHRLGWVRNVARAWKQLALLTA